MTSRMTYAEFMEFEKEHPEIIEKLEENHPDKLRKIKPKCKGRRKSAARLKLKR